MEQSEPLHEDRHKSSFNLTFILAAVVFVFGLYSGGFPLMLVGGAMAAYSWFTTPSRYMIFPDRLWIAYGRPRVRYIFFGQIDQVELLKIPMGDRILVRLTNGRRHFLQPRDIDGFKSKIDSALEEYLREHPETQQTEET